MCKQLGAFTKRNGRVQEEIEKFIVNIENSDQIQKPIFNAKNFGNENKCEEKKEEEEGPNQEDFVYLKCSKIFMVHLLKFLQKLKPADEVNKKKIIQNQIFNMKELKLDDKEVLSSKNCLHAKNWIGSHEMSDFCGNLRASDAFPFSHKKKLLFL